MSRPISGGFNGDLSAAGTSPGYMVEIGFSTVVRASTRGAFTWNSLAFSSRFFSVSGFAYDGTATQGGSITFFNHDNVIGSFCLADGVATSSVKLWKFNGDPPALDRARLIFEGEGDAFTLTSKSVTISCVRKGETIRRFPSLRIKREATRQVITRPGTSIFWNNETLILQNSK